MTSKIYYFYRGALMFGSNDNTQSTQTTDTNSTLGQVASDMMQSSDVTPPMTPPVSDPAMTAPTSMDPMQQTASAPQDLGASSAPVDPIGDTPSIQPTPGSYLSGSPDPNAPAAADSSMPATDMTSTQPTMEQTPSADNPDINDLVLPGTPKATPETTVASIETPVEADDLGLEGIKTKALAEIVPLIDKIDLPPLEKFKTLMMTIQAGDNKSLIPSAYAAAEKIENESERAQALLDVINEINYFSTKKK